MKKFEEVTIGTTPIFKGKIIDVVVEDVMLPNGKTSKREIVRHPGGVAIIPVTKEGKLVLVEQYRKPLERSLIEIPAGKLELGEEPYVTGMRELEEETGYICEKLEFVSAFYVAPGFANEYIHIYEAIGMEKKENSASLDEDEFVELMEVTLEEAWQFYKEGKIADAKTIFALQYLMLKNK
ncbi:MAG: NUDIX domain-containing protein [Bacillaceae bacterium]